MIRKTYTLSVLALLLAASALNAQDWRGAARVEGVVKDQSGAPVAGAEVSLHPSGKTGGPKTKTDKKGRWAILGLKGGDWDVDITAEGFVQKQLGGVHLSELERIPPVDVQLQPMQKVEPQEQTKTESGIPKEAVEAVQQGDALLKDGKYAEAAASYEKALPALPDHVGLLMQLARAYHGAKQEGKSIETLKKVIAKEPDNVGALLLLGNASLESGHLEEGKAYLDKVPASAITDPTAYMNVGILYMNKKRPGEAVDYFSRAIQMDPKSHLGYYYRGLAHIQGQKVAEAKADFHKVVELAPDSAEAKEAKELLPSLK